MTTVQQSGLSGTTKRLLVVMGAAIAVFVSAVIYGLMVEHHTSLDAKRRACVKAHTSSVDVVTDDAAMKKIATRCQARFPS
jgi:hypothetical protein